MKFKNPMFAVSDLEASVVFYKKVLGLYKILDFGTNVTMTGGVCFQTKDSYEEFLGGGGDKKPVQFGGNDAELYFEEDDFDGFIERIEKIEGIEYVQTVCGQRYECGRDR